ncbi:MAG: beta-lactamase family protein [Lentisphaeria bacterium]|nr:beta-lactamase family protein [Lentisphaeria bacterium]
MQINIDVEKLQNLLNEAVAAGEEADCQLAIYKSGKLVADLCVGEKTQSNTLFPIFSVGKGVTSTLALMLYEDGLLDFDAPVAEYWREFARHGKEKVKVWHIFSHRAGLWEMPLLKSYEELGDWQAMIKYMEDAVFQAEPGGKCRYHGFTFGWLAGEVIARAGKKSFNELLREKITEPLQISRELFFGTDAEAETRLALPVVSRFADFTDSRNIFSNNLAVRSGCIPSANGFASARAIAKVYAALSGNGVDGIRLLKDETIKYATQSRRADFDPLPNDLGAWAHFGLGYALAGFPENPGAIFGHGGAMGSEGLAIPELEVGMSFTKNKFNTTHPIHPLRNRISEALNIKIRNW